MARRLAPVPDTPRRVLGIVRVSKERDGMTSPEVQRHAIETYCRASGHDLVDIVEAVDESGSSSKSPWWKRLDKAIAAVEGGEFDGIVVWKFSRVARHRLKWAVALDRVEAAGGILESATEQFDTTTSAGRFARGMTAEMNAFQAELIGDTWREAHERRVREGRPHSGGRRFGYLRNPETKAFEPHPEEGPVLAEIYRRYIAGESPRALAVWLNNHGWRTVRGNLWGSASLRATMASGFASGQIRYRGELVPGIHEPLIDAETWQAFLDQRALRHGEPARRLAAGWWLSGLVRCAKCGGPMIKAGTGRSFIPLRCALSRDKGKVACEGTFVTLPVVEAHVLEYLQGLARDVEESAAAQSSGGARRALSEVEAQRLGREATNVEEALVRLVSNNAMDPLPPEVFREARVRLTERRDALAGSLEALRRDLRREPLDRRQTAVALLEQWDELTVAGRRRIVGGLIDCVLVKATVPRSDRYLRIVEWGEVRVSRWFAEFARNSLGASQGSAT